jgi:hypothetical protein
MSRASALGAALYNTEASWGEAVNTFATRMPTLDMLDVSGLVREKVEAARTVQFLNDGTEHIDGVFGGSFVTRFYLTGHGSATSGATPATSLPTMLQYVLGAAPAAASGTTAAAGSTATVVNTAASDTIADGALVRVGTNGDGRGGGQFAAVSTHITTVMTLLTALGGAPNNGDVIHSAEVVHVLELPSSLAAMTGLRWRLLSANGQFDCHGCFATRVSIVLPVNGELPTIEIEWAVSWWEFQSTTFPTATTQEEFEPAPCGPTGSFFFQTKGTATRATRIATSLAIGIELNTVAIRAPGGVNAGQAVVGARRNPMRITVEFEEEAPTATTTPQSDIDWDEQKHLLYTCNSIAGRALAAYFPRLCPMGTRPSQNSTDGQNRQVRRYAAYTGDARTTDLEAAAIKLAFA